MILFQNVNIYITKLNTILLKIESIKNFKFFNFHSSFSCWRTLSIVQQHSLKHLSDFTLGLKERMILSNQDYTYMYTFRNLMSHNSHKVSFQHVPEAKTQILPPNLPCHLPRWLECWSQKGGVRVCKLHQWGRREHRSGCIPRPQGASVHCQAGPGQQILLRTSQGLHLLQEPEEDASQPRAEHHSLPHP